MDTLYLLASRIKRPRTQEEKDELEELPNAMFEYDEISEGVPIMDRLNLIELSDAVEAAFPSLPLEVRVDYLLRKDLHRVQRVRDLTMINHEIRNDFDRWVKKTGYGEFSDEYIAEQERLFGAWELNIYVKPAVGILEGKSQAFIEAYVKLSGGLGKELLHGK